MKDAILTRARHQTSSRYLHEMEMEIPSVKASANSDVMYSFTSAQDGDPLQDDVRLCLGNDLKKAQDHSQRQAVTLLRVRCLDLDKDTVHRVF
ncbi:hypothetical protein Tco_0316339 [Tanacetum coccineum]